MSAKGGAMSPNKTDSIPTPASLRALSDAALKLRLCLMPRTPEEGDPHAAAKLVSDALCRSEHGKTFAWICESVPLDRLIGKQVNPVLAEIEAVRAIANEVAGYLELKQSQAKERVAEYRKTRTALLRVIADVPLSAACRDELADMYRRLGWVSALSKKGDTRFQYAVYELFDYFRITLNDQVSAVALAPLFTALTGKEPDTVVRDIRRYFQAFAKTTAK
jgi:hypothetical protein